MQTDPASPDTGQPRRAFLRGFLVTLPLQIATVPFGLVFGALAVELGLTAWQAIAMSVIVIGGVSQLVALPMMAEGAPALLVILTAAIVNLRMLMYSAALAARWEGVGRGPRLLAAWFLNDQSFAVSQHRYVERPEMTPAERAEFFLGSGCCCLIFWTAATVAGALAGSRIPEGWPISFAVPLVFIAISVPFLRGAPNLAAAATAAALSTALHGLPYGLGVIPAALAGIAVGTVLSGAKR